MTERFSISVDYTTKRTEVFMVEQKVVHVMSLWGIAPAICTKYLNGNAADWIKKNQCHNVDFKNQSARTNNEAKFVM